MRGPIAVGGLRAATLDASLGMIHARVAVTLAQYVLTISGIVDQLRGWSRPLRARRAQQHGVGIGSVPRIPIVYSNRGACSDVAAPVAYKRAPSLLRERT